MEIWRRVCSVVCVHSPVVLRACIYCFFGSVVILFFGPLPAYSRIQRRAVAKKKRNKSAIRQCRKEVLSENTSQNRPPGALWFAEKMHDPFLATLHKMNPLQAALAGFGLFLAMISSLSYTNGFGLPTAHMVAMWKRVTCRARKAWVACTKPRVYS